MQDHSEMIMFLGIEEILFPQPNYGTQQSVQSIPHLTATHILHFPGRKNLLRL
jgi:hypothetical protein